MALSDAQKLMYAGITLSQHAMAALETRFERFPTLPKWSLRISRSQPC